MAKRYARYYPQFFISEYPMVTHDGVIAFIPKVNVEEYNVDQLKSILGKLQNKEKERTKKLLDDIEKNSKTTLSIKELKALVAYLNSTLVWNWLEFKGRAVSMGPLALEVNIVKDIPIPNLKGLSEKDVDNLAKLFDELEAEARKHQDMKDVLDTLNFLEPIKQKIDRKICEIYGLKINVEALWNSTVEMMQRRIAGNAREKLDLGSEKEIKKKKGRKGKTVSLESFMYED